MFVKIRKNLIIFAWTSELITSPGLKMYEQIECGRWNLFCNCDIHLKVGERKGCDEGFTSKHPNTFKSAL